MVLVVVLQTHLKMNVKNEKMVFSAKTGDAQMHTVIVTVLQI
jgi:hypothetical protein